MKTVLKGVYSLLIATTLLSGVSLFAGCNTAEGVGKDTKAVGQKVEDTAKDNK